MREGGAARPHLGPNSTRAHRSAHPAANTPHLLSPENPLPPHTQNANTSGTYYSHTYYYQNANGSRYTGFTAGRPGGIYTPPGETKGHYCPPKPGK